MEKKEVTNQVLSRLFYIFFIFFFIAFAYTQIYINLIAAIVFLIFATNFMTWHILREIEGKL